MRWESRLLAVIDDLEQQASGMHLAERDLEVDDLAQAEYAAVTLASRCRASLGHDVTLRVLGGLVLRGRLVRAGEEWLVVHEGRQGGGPSGRQAGGPGARTAWLVPTAALVRATGLSERSAHESTWSVSDRLSLRSLLRRVGVADEECQLCLRDGDRVAGRIVRVGRDFLELTGVPQQVVPLGALAAVRWRS